MGRRTYKMCERKRKLKSGEANKMASRFNQRKYECPICGHWHLTKMKGDQDEPGDTTKTGDPHSE